MSHLITKPTKWHVRPAKTQITLGIRPVWSKYSLSARRKLRVLASHWAYSEDSDQTGSMPRLIWVFTGRTVILFVLSWGGSYDVDTTRTHHIKKSVWLCCLRKHRIVVIINVTWLGNIRSGGAFVCRGWYTAQFSIISLVYRQSRYVVYAKMYLLCLR